MTSMGSEYDEKRNFIRMFVNASVIITDPATDETYKGEGKNLSGDGAMFTTDKFFDINQKLNLKISSEQSKLASLSAEFEVKRVEEISAGLFEIAGTMLEVH